MSTLTPQRRLINLTRLLRTSNLVQCCIPPMADDALGARKKFLRGKRLMRRMEWRMREVFLSPSLFDKKFELMLTRRAKAYSSSGLVF